MNLDDRISESLNQGLAQLDAHPPALDDVEHRGRRVRRRRVALAATVAALVAGVAVVTPRLVDGDAVGPANSTGTWQPLPAPPLSPRAHPVTAWTGEEALVIGGYLTLCPPNAICRMRDKLARDGAAYNPESGTWREISEPPVAMANYFRSTMVGDTLVLFDGQRDWFAYDVSDDEWRALPSPRQDVVDSGPLTVVDGVVYVVGRPGPVLGLDVAEGRWVVLPDAFLGGAHAETVVFTSHGFVLSGSWDDGSPAEAVAQLWDGSTRQPLQTGQLNPFRHWTGERLVELDLQTTTKSDGTTTPYGGMLDPSTGKWSPLPNAPELTGTDGWSPVAADGPLMAGWGYVYDDRDESWTALGRPDGAAAEADLSAVWADGRLLVFGGVDRSSEPVNETWVWTP